MKNLFIASLIILISACGGDFLDPSKAPTDADSPDQESDDDAASSSLTVTQNGNSWTYVSGKAVPDAGSGGLSVELFLWDETESDPCNTSRGSKNEIYAKVLRNQTTFFTTNQKATLTDTTGDVDVIDSGKVSLSADNTNSLDMVFNATESDSLKAVGSFTVTVCN